MIWIHYQTSPNSIARSADKCCWTLKTIVKKLKVFTVGGPPLLLTVGKSKKLFWQHIRIHSNIYVSNASKLINIMRWSVLQAKAWKCIHRSNVMIWRYMSYIISNLYMGWAAKMQMQVRMSSYAANYFLVLYGICHTGTCSLYSCI